MDVLHLIGRILLGGFFLYNGLNHFTSHEMMTGYARSKGVPAAGLAVGVAGLLLLLGGSSILLGWYPFWGILLLTLFLLPVSFTMHDFWNQEGEAKQNEMIHFAKNFALLGALWALAAFPPPWPFGLGG